ncbi:MAG TPA: TlpA disulfide reductase family protein, partial [Candidatus Methanoperedens sp.]|nr:TlpA disulfide reductase family protein [Candidatus Methanoperedens sp.]
AGSPAAAEEQGFTPIPVIKGIKSLATGAPAPVFAVKDADGKVFDFAAEQTKRAHVLVFWSIFCEPCREEMPVIERLANEYRPGGQVEILTVNMDGVPFLDGIKGFVRQYKYSFRVLLDELDAKGETFAVADPYQVAGTPVLYLVDAQGKVAGSHLGRIAEADLRALITAMLGAK